MSWFEKLQKAGDCSKVQPANGQILRWSATTRQWEVVDVPGGTETDPLSLHLDQTTPQTIGSTGSRLSKLWATDIAVTNAITGDITGNAGTVTNATLTTALTVNTGTVTLKGNVANTSALTIGAGAVSISGSNTGDQDLSGLVLKTYTVNGHALSGNVSVTLSDVGGEASGTTATHAALTATHGISGAIVGTIDTQSLTNKTFDQLKTSQTVTVAATDLVWGNSIATHKVPIVLNGTTYYILLVDS